MAGLLDFIGDDAATRSNPYGMTGADRLGLLGQALMGFGSGLSRRRAPGLSLTPGGGDPGTSGFGEAAEGAAGAYQSGMANLQRRALLDRQLAADQRAARMDDLKLRQATRAEADSNAFRAAIQSGDQAQINDAFRKYYPKEWYAAQQKDGAPLVVAPGSTVLDKRTGRPTFTAPAKPENESTPDIREFRFAQEQGFKGNFTDWMQRKRATSGEYGMQPIYGQGLDGQPAIMQLGKDGRPIQVQMPNGFRLAKDPLKVDLGTHFAIIDPQTRQVVSTLPKDVQGEKAAEVRGKEQGAAQAGLPAAEMNADNMLTMLDEMANHPGRKSAQGDFYGRGPDAIYSGEARGFVDRFNQVKGQSFLKAFESLKGGGAITEAEGAKAAAAMDRLNRATNDKEFNSAVADLRAVINKGRMVQRSKASGGAAATTDYKSKYGLD